MAPAKKVIVDSDKGIWTVEEVCELLKAAGLTVELTKPDGDTHDTEVVPEDESASSDASSDVPAEEGSAQ